MHISVFCGGLCQYFRSHRPHYFQYNMPRLRPHSYLHRDSIPAQDLSYVCEVWCLYSKFYDELHARSNIPGYERRTVAEFAYWRVKPARRSRPPPYCRFVLSTCRSQESRVCQQQDTWWSRARANDSVIIKANLLLKHNGDDSRIDFTGSFYSWVSFRKGLLSEDT